MTNAYRLFFPVCSLALLLCGCGSSHRERLQQLETLEAFNIADSVMTNDSLAQVLCDYFDEHGTPNERMRAHYILGRTYADLGEAPAALEAYLDAAAAADTTAADCDWAKLSRVYGQMSSIYYKQGLMDDYFTVESKSIRSAWMAKDTVQALLESILQLGTYDRKNMPDSVIAVFDSLYRCYGHSNEQLFASCATIAAKSSLDKGCPERAKVYLSLYEQGSGFFSSSGISKGREVYYNLKGRYYQSIQELDSAELFFRRELADGSDLNNQNMGAKYLAYLLLLKNQPDSAAKYALYSYDMNDSIYALRSTEEVEKTKNLYNYNHYQHEAFKNAEEAHAANLRFIIAAVILVILIITTAFFIRWKQKKSMVQSAKYRAAIIERNKLRKEIESLTAKDYDTIIARKEREIAELNKTIEQQGTMHRQVMANDKLSVFEKSAVVQVFKDKRTYHKGQEPVSNDEWKALVSQFRSDMPSASSSMSSLSPLQLHVCILLLLGFEEGEIALVCQTRPQVITNAKARANQKLFLSSDSASLKDNLISLVAS